MVRHCTECGSAIGDPHVRSKLYAWKRKPRDLIEKDKKRMQEAIILQAGQKYKRGINPAGGGGG